MIQSYKSRTIERNRNDSRVHRLTDAERSKLHQILLEMYLDIQNTCEKHSLACMLLGGSALGAVRHHGFIPWDDDLDIGMPREDYEVFKKLFESELSNKYILNAPNYSDRPIARFPKVLKPGTRFVELGSIDDERSCVFVDIFVLDGIPDSFIHRLAKGTVCTALMFIASCVSIYEQSSIAKQSTSVRARIGKLFSSLSSQAWFSLVDSEVQYGLKNCKNVGIPTGRKHYFGEILSRETMLPPTQCMFEGHNVYIPRDWDSYLRNLYGNYMVVPPEEQREQHYVSDISL